MGLIEVSTIEGKSKHLLQIVYMLAVGVIVLGAGVTANRIVRAFACSCFDFCCTFHKSGRPGILRQYCCNSRV